MLVNHQGGANINDISEGIAINGYFSSSARHDDPRLTWHLCIQYPFFGGFSGFQIDVLIVGKWWLYNTSSTLLQIYSSRALALV